MRYLRDGLVRLATYEDIGIVPWTRWRIGLPPPLRSLGLFMIESAYQLLLGDDYGSSHLRS